LSDYDADIRNKKFASQSVIEADKKTGEVVKETIIPIHKPENVGEKMCIDEKMIGNRYCTLMSNADTGKLALLVESMNPAVIKEAISKFGIQAQQKVGHICLGSCRVTPIKAASCRNENYTSDNASNNTWATDLSGTSVYQEIIKEDATSSGETKGYDANGNILGIKRTGKSLAYFDEMNYTYNLVDGKVTNNRLQNVKDNASNQNGTANDFTSNQPDPIYSYDDKGRLKSDASEEIESIAWTPFDKVASITRKAESNKPGLIFGYDGMGRRVSKTVTYPKNTDGTTNANDYTEYTVYEAGGKVLATYKVDNSTANATASLSETFVCGV
jgi:hypothetical protein